MNEIALDADVLKMILERIDKIEDRVAKLIKKSQYPLKERWLDNQDVCSVLKISPRLLQMYRDEKVIPFSQINSKIYYRAVDIDKFLARNYRPILGY